MQSHGVGLVSKDSMMVSYIAFNMSDGVVGKNKLLRQAMTCAFDAEAWIKLNKGRVAFADGPVPPNVEARLEEPNPLQYNLERAKELIAQAGYKDGIDPATGRPLQLTLDLGRTDQETRESAELIASFMQQIGIELNLQFNNWPLFLKKISRRESQLFMVAWLADYPDALNFLQLFYSENASPGPNRCNYNNPEYDKLYEAACVERNPEVRGEYIREMQRIIRDEAPWIFIHYGRDNILLKPHLKNVIPHDFPYGMEKHWRTK
jgi:ABC-type transport system substrate-binding protein